LGNGWNMSRAWDILSWLLTRDWPYLDDVGWVSWEREAMRRCWTWNDVISGARRGAFKRWEQVEVWSEDFAWGEKNNVVKGFQLWGLLGMVNSWSSKLIESVNFETNTASRTSWLECEFEKVRQSSRMLLNDYQKRDEI
jgi:hypothetical protein